MQITKTAHSASNSAIASTAYSKNRLMHKQLLLDHIKRTEGMHIHDEFKSRIMALPIMSQSQNSKAAHKG